MGPEAVTLFTTEHYTVGQPPRILLSNGNQLMMSLDWTCQQLSAGIFNHPLLADARFSPAILWTLLGLWILALILFRIQSATLFAVGLIATLAIVHHDFWNWGVTERSIGGLPQGFVFHVGLSIVAAFLWWIVTLIAWPKDEWTEANEIKSQTDEASDTGAQA